MEPPALSVDFFSVKTSKHQSHFLAFHEGTLEWQFTIHHCQSHKSFDASTEMKFLERAGQRQYDVPTEWQANVSASSREEIKRRWWSDLQYVSPSVGPPKKGEQNPPLSLDVCLESGGNYTNTHTSRRPVDRNITSLLQYY